ncbi:hypothetical protein [Streptomyces nigra]|uniref:hypothetical protein n=1 Tax=Streptomyces nigra TaxID=1827580 RepID=UPI0035E30CE5
MHGAGEAVGDLWQPDGPSPAWRELDGPARLRRVGRLIATVAAIGLALAAWSALATAGGTPGQEPGGRTVPRVEEAPAAVPTTSHGNNSAAPTATAPMG